MKEAGGLFECLDDAASRMPVGQVASLCTIAKRNILEELVKLHGGAVELQPFPDIFPQNQDGWNCPDCNEPILGYDLSCLGKLDTCPSRKRQFLAKSQARFCEHCYEHVEAGKTHAGCPTYKKVPLLETLLKFRASPDHSTSPWEPDAAGYATAVVPANGDCGFTAIGLALKRLSAAQIAAVWNRVPRYTEPRLEKEQLCYWPFVRKFREEMQRVFIDSGTQTPLQGGINNDLDGWYLDDSALGLLNTFQDKFIVAVLRDGQLLAFSPIVPGLVLDPSRLEELEGELSAKRRQLVLLKHSNGDHFDLLLKKHDDDLRPAITTLAQEIYLLERKGPEEDKPAGLKGSPGEDEFSQDSLSDSAEEDEEDLQPQSILLTPSPGDTVYIAHSR